MSTTLAMAPTGSNPAGFARAMLAVGDLLREGIAVYERRPGSVHLTRRQVSRNEMAGVLEAMFEAPPEYASIDLIIDGIGCDLVLPDSGHPVADRGLRAMLVTDFGQLFKPEESGVWRQPRSMLDGLERAASLVKRIAREMSVDGPQDWLGWRELGPPGGESTWVYSTQDVDDSIAAEWRWAEARQPEKEWSTTKTDRVLPWMETWDGVFVDELESGELLLLRSPLREAGFAAPPKRKSRR